jgi:hypothetical protein
MDWEDRGGTMGKIVAKAWEDEEFKLRLLKDATRALQDEGLAVPEGVTVKVLENTPEVFHLIIPSKPAFELTDDELTACAGGGLAGGCCLFDSRGYGILW